MLSTDRPFPQDAAASASAAVYGAVVRRRPTAPAGSGGGGAPAAGWRRGLARRSDPGLSGVYGELAAVDSGWDVSAAAATTGCGVARSSSLRNSFLLGRAREPLWIHSMYTSLAFTARA